MLGIDTRTNTNRRNSMHNYLRCTIMQLSLYDPDTTPLLIHKDWSRCGESTRQRSRASAAAPSGGS